jgi:hypothetical protein
MERAIREVFMATVSDRTRDPLAVPPWTTETKEGSKSDQYLAKRFAAASADLKAMAMATFLLAFAIAGVAWLIVGVLVEHWLVPGGLPDAVRWGWFVVGMAAAVWACVKWLVPLVRYRVNLVFAARELERGHPDLHNDLVNAVLVKERSGEAAEAVVKSLRRRAARRLSSVDEEGIVDRTPAVRLAWVLTALVCGMILYAVLAPKSVITSAARLAAPWKGMVAPSRVQIERPRLAWRMPGEDVGLANADRSLGIVDGKAELVRGRVLQVSSVIDGLETDERPELIVTPLRDDGTTDAPLAPWRIAMTAGSGGVQTVLVPGADRGLDSSVELQIVAGDGRSERVRVVVVDAPSLLVRELRYDYPEYMSRESETLPWQGGIRAVEGTRVTVIAEANRPLDVAAIDLGCDGRRNVSLALEKPKATTGKASFLLELNADRTGPKVASYRFIYRPKAASGQPTEPDVTSPLEHRIEVTPDLAPEVAIEDPTEKVLRVPPDAPVTVRIRAMDPDFGLAKVHVETRLDGGEIRQGDELLVGRPRLAFRGAATLVPQALGAKPGNKLEFRAVAIDTRPDLPNRTVTEWQLLEIDASAPPQEQPPKDGDDEQQGDKGKPQDGDQGQVKGDQKGQGQEGQGEPGDNQGDAGGTQKGEGQGESQEAQGAGDQGQGNQGEGQAPDGQGDKGEGQQGDGQSGQAAGDNGQGEGKQGEGRGSESGQEQGQGENGTGRGNEGSGEQGETRPPQGNQGNGQQKGRGEQTRGQGQQRSGEQPGQAEGKGEPSESKPVASDGTDDGEAIERILENRRQQGEGQPSQENQGQANQSQDQQGQGQGEEQQGQKGQGQQEQQDGGQPGASQGQPDQGQGEPQAGEGQSGQQSEGQSGQGESGTGQDGAGQQGEGKQGEGQSGTAQEGKEQQPVEGEPGQREQGEGDQPGQGKGQAGGGKEHQQGKEGQGQQGQGQQGQGQQGQGQQGQGQQGQGQQGQGQQGQGQQGQGQQGEGQQGEGQQGEGQQGEGQQGEGGEKGQGKSGQAAGQRGQGAGEATQPGGQSQEQGGESQPTGEGEGQGGQGGRGDASDGRGGEGQAQPLERREMQWTNQDLEHARNAANLAIEHLRDSLAKGRTDILDDLGWTPEQARAFLDRWQQMQQQAAQGDPRQRAEFENAVRSLGLRPAGVQTSRDVPTDRRGGQAEGRRSRPPSDYREQFKAFMQGTSVE